MSINTATPRLMYHVSLSNIIDHLGKIGSVVGKLKLHYMGLYPNFHSQKVVPWGCDNTLLSSFSIGFGHLFHLIVFLIDKLCPPFPELRLAPISSELPMVELFEMPLLVILYRGLSHHFA